ncbi:MAG: hypothetical protein EXS08_15470 [Planctomycetes bacterium]|nr:hypothetical protein [Planctomycetota bacterium]
MLARFAPLLLCLAQGGAQESPAPVLRVTDGEARLGAGSDARTLDLRAGAVPLGAAAHVESRPRSQLELTWRGSASATFDGPAVFELAPGTGLVLQRFQTVEVEVRRGPLRLEFAGLGQLELAGGALQARRLPNGVVELLNRGGTPFELRRSGVKPLVVAPGARLRLHSSATDS